MFWSNDSLFYKTFSSKFGFNIDLGYQDFGWIEAEKAR
jgi:hypothetical protein